MTTHLYPEIRRYLDTYTAREVAARLPELLASGEPIAITRTGHGPWVLVPSQFYDTLIVTFAALNSRLEQRRQAAEPLPPIDVKP